MEDEARELIDKIYDYAGEHATFDTDFVERINEFLICKGYVTDAQLVALQNIVQGFRMD